MSESDRGLRDLLTLTPMQRRVVIRLTRQGPANAQILAQSIGVESAEIVPVLETLARQGQIELDDTGQAAVRLGRTRPRALPERLWPALTASNRLYSTQEIATLRTVIPILQFARAKLSEFADHGPNHAFRVKSFATQLGYLLGLNPIEQHLLRAAALFHDVGNIVDRHRHHIISQETVEQLTGRGELPFSGHEASLIGLLCRWHRKEYEPERTDELADQVVRTGLLAGLLRVADAMDIDQRRADYSPSFMRILRFFYPQELPYWTSLTEIVGVRIHGAPHITLQVMTRGVVEENMQIDMLRRDLAQTPLGWSVRAIPVLTAAAIPSVTPSVAQGATNIGRALLAFPFDPHSLVMAAISRTHLQAAGYAVELLCYPDNHAGSAQLWRDDLRAYHPADFARLIVLGDRPEPSLTPRLLATVEEWQSGGATLSLLNRHEANWGRLPALLQAGVEVLLGGDWAYFWGDQLTPQEWAWCQIASLCTRDPTQSTVDLTEGQRIRVEGLLTTVYDALRTPPGDAAGWNALATPILEQIASDTHDMDGDGVDGDGSDSHQDTSAYFAMQAARFRSTYATLPTPPTIEGQVLMAEISTLAHPSTCYWALEAAIEAQGRTLAHGVHFRIPYAIARWRDGDDVELLAISHWREEAAAPIRLLYPTELGTVPEGNESTLRLRLPAAQADTVIRTLIQACNQPL